VLHGEGHDISLAPILNLGLDLSAVIAFDMLGLNQKNEATYPLRELQQDLQVNVTAILMRDVRRWSSEMAGNHLICLKFRHQKILRKFDDSFLT
jgi:hypothetical protein